MRAVFVSDGKILTTGFSRMSERQVALWDTVSAWGEGGAATRQDWRLSPHPVTCLIIHRHGPQFTLCEMGVSAGFSVRAFPESRPSGPHRPDLAQLIVPGLTHLYRSTWRSRCPCRSWTRAVASCCPSLTPTPT